MWNTFRIARCITRTHSSETYLLKTNNQRQPPMGQKSSKIEITKTDKAILQLKISKDELHRYTRRTERLLSTERLQLKQILKEDQSKDPKKNPRARLMLKRIHYQSHLLQQASDQLINLENLVSNVEFKLIEQQFIQGLSTGNEILTKLNQEFRNVDNLLDNVQEQINYQEEIDTALANSVVGGGLEDELDRELQALDNEINPTREPDMPSVVGLPPIHREEKTPEQQEETEEAQKESQQEEPVLAS